MRQYPRTPFTDWSQEQKDQFNRIALFGLLGVVIGFFLATVFWPAEATDSSLDGLQPDLRAQYLSALADAYVATGGDNAATVLSRLNDLRDPETELIEAIRYYQNFDSEVAALHEFNLRTLAAQFSNINSLPTESFPSDAVPSETASASWLDWLLIGLAMVMLIGGGLWIFYQFVLFRGDRRDSRPTNDFNSGNDYGDGYDEEDGGFYNDLEEDEDEDFDTRPRKLTREEQQANWEIRQRQVLGDTERPRKEEPLPPQPFLLPSPPDDITVETEVDVAPRRRPPEDTGEEMPQRDMTSSAPPARKEPQTDQPQNDDAGEPPATQPLAEAEAPPDVDRIRRDRKSRSDNHNRPGADDADKRKPTSVTPASAPPPGENRRNSETGFIGHVQDQIAGLRKREKSAPAQAMLAEFQAKYYYGITDYDESFTITAPADSKDILGACGVGTDAEVDPPSASSDKVRVLDIWLYDKSSMRTQNQLLVARGVNLDSIPQKIASSGSITGDPLVIERGLTFKLRAEQLVLECKIEDVSYVSDAADAPFQSVILSITVAKKM
ncbi:hypothetical protein GC175_12905 [bacterium]|nr:hypothetical protein [bacterium]